MRTLTIGCNVDHRLELHVIVQRAWQLILHSVKVEVAAYPRPALIDSPQGDFDCAVRREDAGQIVPLVTSQVVPISCVQALDLVGKAVRVSK